MQHLIPIHRAGKSTRSIPSVCVYLLIVAFAAALSPGAFAQTAQQIEQLKLPAACTLTYKVTHFSDLRPTAEKLNDVAEKRREYALLVKSGALTQSQVDTMLAALDKRANSAPKPEYSVVTLSTRDGKFLYQRASKLDPDSDFVIIQDSKRVFLRQTIDHSAMFAQKLGQLDTNVVLFLPIPGVGLPYLPIVTGATPAEESLGSGESFAPTGPRRFLGNVLESELGTRIGTLPGYVEATDVDGLPKVLSITFGPRQAPWSRWEFMEHQKLGNVWIPSRMRWTDYDNGSPESTYTFDLQNASASGLDPKQFDPRTWLVAGDTLYVHEGTRECSNLTYNPATYGRMDSDAKKLIAAAIAWDKLAPVTPTPVLGQIAPDFTATTISGDSISLSQFRGKVVLVEFWATWCAPCRQEMPGVISVYQKHHKDGLEMISISLDGEPAASAKEAKQKVTAFAAAKGITWPLIIDDNKQKLSRLYGNNGIPFLVLVGRDGKVAAVNHGGDWLEPAVERALASP